MDDYVDTMLEADIHEIRRSDGGPMRDVLRLHPTMEVRMYPSWKTGWPVYTTGGLELAWRIVFEADPCVVEYRSQPLTLVFPLDGKIASYTPDFQVLRRAPAEIVEAKPARMLQRDVKLRRKLDRVRQIYAARGIPFRILGYEQLPGEDWMAAAEDVADLGRTYIDPLDVRAVTGLLSAEGPTTLARAATAVTRHPDPLRAVVSLALRPRSILIEMTGPVTPDTGVRLRGRFGR